MKVKKVKLILILYYFALFKVFIIPTIFQQLTKVAIVLMVFIYVLNRQKLKDLFNATLFFSCFIIVSCLYNTYVTGLLSSSSALNGVLHACCIYLSFMLITYCAKNNMMNYVVDSLLLVLSIYAVMSFVSILIYGTSSAKEICYFAGNKFSTSYYFMLLWATIYVKNYDKIKNNNALFISYKFSFIILVLICYGLRCSTAVVGSIVMFVMMFFSKKIRRLFFDWKFIIGSMAGVGIILLILRQIVEISYVKYFIINLLGENTGLTGRFKIYRIAYDVIKIHPFLGFGYGNNAVRMYVASYFGNFQNSIIQGVIDYGILGAVSFGLLIRKLFIGQKNGKIDLDEYSRIWGMFTFIYSMIICSIVEITFDYKFYTALFIVGAYNMQLVKKKYKDE